MIRGVLIQVNERATPLCRVLTRSEWEETPIYAPVIPLEERRGRWRERCEDGSWLYRWREGEPEGRGRLRQLRVVAEDGCAL